MSHAPDISSSLASEACWIKNMEKRSKELVVLITYCSFMLTVLNTF